MKRYWKIGCNWGGKGSPDFYSLMKKKSFVIFADKRTPQIGDIVAITRGHNVFALAEIVGKKIPVTDFKELENEFSDCQIPYDDWVFVAKCKIFEFAISDQFDYELQQGFCEIHISDIKKQLDSLYIKMISKQIKEEWVKILKHNHNLILTGAPGTGKTYLAKQIAQQMIFGEVKEKMTEEEEKQFNEQCGFVQFHPSYDYTDFVEGLRPKNDNGNVGFERKDGVFKEFCKKALLRSDSNDTSLFNGINDNPKVWKVSLSGTGDNEIRTYCKENNCIRIGWEEYGNVEDFSEYDFKESEVAKNFRSKELAVGEKILKSFQNEMVIGDIVVSCYSEKETDAIGIITGDYEYIEDLANNYPRCRKVRWIWKGEPIDIMELNNKKKLTLSTIYKLDIDPISIKDFITKKGGYIESKKENRKYIFIIDEINRGEISKIFGELFFSIDPGYRGKKGKVQTQYQNMIEEGDVFKDGFYVPENVYIIGTMNDIDRSVESMDFAFRRRFAFVEVKANENTGMLNGKAWENDAIKRMNSLNAEIEKIEGLSSAYHIGASYFLKLDKYNGDFGQLWEYHLDGLLREYLRGTQGVDENMKKLKNAYNLINVVADDPNSNN